jgi:hypothetical protein
VGNQVCERRAELLADSRRAFDGNAPV